VHGSAFADFAFEDVDAEWVENFSLNGAGVDLFEALPRKHELKEKDQHVYKN